jgi:hypothetical protein
MQILKTANRAEGMAPVVEHLLSKCEAPSSNPNAAKKKSDKNSSAEPSLA